MWLLCFSQAVCRWLFNASSMESKLQCRNGRWRALMQPRCESLALPVYLMCPTFPCTLHWEGNPAPRVISQWDKKRKGEWTYDLSGLQRFSFLLWKQSGPQNRCWSENWWPFWTIPAFLCLLMETVGCEMQYVRCSARLACCCHRFLLLDASALTKYHCSRESLVPLLENPGKLWWLYFAWNKDEGSFQVCSTVSQLLSTTSFD